MKRCPYCAESVQDEAIVCRYCGKGIPTGVLDLTDKRQRYAAGPTTEEGTLGLWDLEKGGPPLATYPEAGGWPQLLDHLDRLESGGGGPLGRGDQDWGGVLLVGLGGLLIAVGSFLPWISATAPFVGTISKNGLEGGDGIATLILGAVTLLIAILRIVGAPVPAILQRSPIVTGVAAGIVGGLNLSDVQNRVAQATSASRLVTASVGAGLWTILIGAGMAIVGGLLLRPAKVRMAQTTRPDPPPRLDPPPRPDPLGPGLPPPPGPPRGRQNRVLLIALGVIAVIVIAVYLGGGYRSPGGGGGGGGSGTHTVVYEVSGSAGSVDVTYAKSSGDTSQQSGLSLPWSTTLEGGSGSFVYISAQNQGDVGYETCSISVDGATVASNESSGAYTICQASGSIP